MNRINSEKPGGFVWYTVLEIVIIFCFFVLEGAWPVPDVNEQYYIGKAIHFWNPEWMAQDPFFNTPNSHWFFCLIFGTLSLFLSPLALAWTGRFLIWFLIAWGWQRLSNTLIPGRWVSVLTAVCFFFYLDNFHLAGEWIIGGVEGKGFAFPLVFLGLAAFLQGKYNRAWILYGLASAFHVLVGGWVVLASLFAWLLIQISNRGSLICAKNIRGRKTDNKLVEKNREASKREGNTDGRDIRQTGIVGNGFRMLPGLLVGGGIALLGIIPALMLDYGAPADMVHEAHRIYVYERLSHHLVPSMLPWTFQLRFLTLTVLMLFLWGWRCYVVSVFSQRDNFGTVRKPENLSILVHKESNGSPENRDPNSIGHIGIEPSESGSGEDGTNWYDGHLPGQERWFALFCFILGALLIAGLGLVWDFGVTGLKNAGWISESYNAADLLRFYWFRLSDWAVPLGITFVSVQLFFLLLESFWKEWGKKTGNWVIFWLIGFFALFWGVKTYLFWESRQIAAQLSKGLPYPISPKPVEGLSFVVTLFLIVLLLTLVFWFVRYVIRRKEFIQAGNSAFLKTGCFVGLFLLTGIMVWGGPVYHAVILLNLRASSVIPRSNPPKESISNGWLETCQWVKNNTPKEAVFLVPRGCDSFKWNTDRAEVGSWKEIPQDAMSIIDWYHRMERLYTTGKDKSEQRWNMPLVAVLISKGRTRVLKECEEYHIQYIIVENPPYAIASQPKALERFNDFVKNERVYHNDQFTVFRFDPEIKKTDEKRVKAE